MKLSFNILLIFGFVLFANQSFADRENDMWQQFKAQKGMGELDAEFDEPKPEPKVVERVIEKSVPVPQPEPASSEDPVPVSAPEPESQLLMVTVESQGYVFKLGSCKKSHRNINCALTITSVDKDGELTLYSKYGSHSSKLFDHNGNEYQPATITMGNKSHRGQVRNKYISGVTARGGVEFVDVDANTNSISMFELSLRNYETRKSSRIQFRDVNLSL